jgi:hypothetical protein
MLRFASALARDVEVGNQHCLQVRAACTWQRTCAVLCQQHRMQAMRKDRRFELPPARVWAWICMHTVRCSQSYRQVAVGQCTAALCCAGVAQFVRRAFEDSISGILNKRQVDVLHDIKRKRAKGEWVRKWLCGGASCGGGARCLSTSTRLASKRSCCALLAAQQNAACLVRCCGCLPCMSPWCRAGKRSWPYGVRAWDRAYLI